MVFGSLRVWALGICALMPLASPSNLPALDQTRPHIEVRGTVVDEVDGRPVEDVRVVLVQRVPGGQQSLSETAVTDARGGFVLLAPAPGEYSISASRGSLAFGEYGREGPAGTQRWFAVSGPTRGIVIRLWKRPSVSGRVLDENDQPLRGVFVYAMSQTTVGHQQVLKIAGSATTGTDGTYLLNGWPGRYLLAAVPPLRASAPTRRVHYHPGVTTSTAASPLDLVRSRQLDGIDFRLGRERGFGLSGAVELSADLGGPNSVELFDTSPDSLPTDFALATARLSPLGTFAFPPVPAGSYEIRLVKYAASRADVVADGAIRYTDQRFAPVSLARAPEGATWWASERVSVVDTDISVALPLRPGVRVSGRVIFEGPRQRPEPAVLRRCGVYLRSVDHRFFRPFQVGSVAENGTFATTAVPPGRYVLGVLTNPAGTEPYPGYQLESVKIDGRDVAGISFDLAGDVHDAVLTFSSRPTAISGTVAGERGQQRFVLVWPEDEALWSGRGSQLGRTTRALTVDGPYRLPVFPGSYRVVALEGLPPADWEATSYLRSLYPFSEGVIVPAGQEVVLNLALTKLR